MSRTQKTAPPAKGVPAPVQKVTTLSWKEKLMP